MLFLDYLYDVIMWHSMIDSNILWTVLGTSSLQINENDVISARSQDWSIYVAKQLRSIHTYRLLACFIKTAPFFINIVFMKNGDNGLQPILSVFQPITIITMLNKNGLFL